MDPKTYALVEDGVVVNLIWLEPRNATDFPGAVECGDIPVAIGFLYLDGTFLDPNPPMPVQNALEGEQPA